MTLEEKIQGVLARLNPKLEELANGSVELERLDENQGVLAIKLFGGRLH